MIHWSAFNFGGHVKWLERKRKAAQRIVATEGRDSQVPGVENNRVVEERHEIYKCLDSLGHLCSEMQMHTSYQRCFGLLVRVGNPNVPCYWTQVEEGLQEIQWALEHALIMRKFAFIPPGKDKYFERDDLFGEAVNKAFPSAKADIKCAGNCLAADLADGAVFYLMRVASIGARTSARNLGVEKIGDKELEFCGDQTIYEKIDEMLREKKKALDTGTHNAHWEAESSYYRGLLEDLRYFKDEYRNPMAHTRKNYDYNQAQSAFNHVRDFMQRLAAAGIVE
jgi:hypothetical protein